MIQILLTQVSPVHIAQSSFYVYTWKKWRGVLSIVNLLVEVDDIIYLGLFQVGNLKTITQWGGG